jgi:hypothetical protein
MGDSFYHIFYHPIPVFVVFILQRAWRWNTQCDVKKFSHGGYQIDIKENM